MSLPTVTIQTVTVELDLCVSLKKIGIFKYVFFMGIEAWSSPVPCTVPVHKKEGNKRVRN